MAQPVEGTISQVDEIQDQIRNQERLLAQLHESILEQDKQLLGREAEAQSYASKLKSLKSRHLHDQKSYETPTQETSGLSEQKTPAQTPRSSGSLTLLRQKVEENRLKVAQRGRQELESKRELEEKVLALKSQLEEIQKASVTTDPVLSDQNPVDTQMIVLQEQIQAKDSLIEARTRAITLLTEDFSRKRKEVVDQLEETREEMRRMQANFVACEDRYKAEIQARDERLFEMDSKLRTLNTKFEHTEDINVILAEKENLQKQVNDLIVIRNEKQSLEDKLKELLNIQNLYEQKEMEISIILGEKLKLEAELSEINRKREEESSSYVKRMQNLQKKVEKLSKHLALNESKMKEMSVIVDTCHVNEEKLISLSLEKQNLEEKVEELTRIIDSQQQTKVEMSAYIDSSQHQENEMTILLEEKLNLQQKLKSAIEYFNVPQRELKRPSAKKQDHSKKLQEVVELTKMLLANDQKIQDFQHNLNSNKSGYLDSEPLFAKIKLEEKLEQLSNLLDIYRQAIKDLCTRREDDDINNITQIIEACDNITKADKEELCSLIERNKETMEKVDSISKELDESKKELSEQAMLMTAFKLKETELQNELGIYQKKCTEILENKEHLEEKVAELEKLLKENHHIHSNAMSTLHQEKVELENNIQDLSKCLRDTEKSLQEQYTLEFVALCTEKQVLEDRLKELTEKVDYLNANQYQQDHQFSLFLEEKQELSNIVISREHSLQELTKQLQSLQLQHSEELSVMLQEKHQLQVKVDELSKLVASKERNMQGLTDQLTSDKEQHSEELSLMLQEKHQLQVNVDELSKLIAANEQNMQGLSSQLTAKKEQHSEELSVMLQEKHQLQVKVDELSKLFAANEQNLQGLSFQLTAKKEQHSEELSAMLQEKHQLQVKLDELSKLVAANEQNMQGLTDQLTAEKEQHSEELSALLQEKHQLQMKVDGLSKGVAAKEQNMLVLGDELEANKKHYSKELTILLEEKQLLEVQLEELSKQLIIKELAIDEMREKINSVQQLHNKELSSIFEEKQVLHETVAENVHAITALENKVQCLTDNLKLLQLHNEELSTLLQEKQQLQDKVRELSDLVVANEQNVQGLKDHLITSQQQHLEEKQLLEDEVSRLSALVTLNENNLQALMDQLAGTHKELSALVEEKQLLSNKCVEYSNTLEANEQRLGAMKHINEEQERKLLALMNEKQVEHKHIVSSEENVKHHEEEFLQQKVHELFSVAPVSRESLQGEDASQYHQQEWSSFLTERQLLQEKVQELFFYLKQNVQVLKEFKVPDNEEIRTDVADSLDDKTFDQVDLQSLMAEYKANIEQLKKERVYALRLFQEKQTLQDHLGDIYAQHHSQLEEKTHSLAILMQEKTVLELQLDEVSKKAEEREKLIHQQNSQLREQLNSLKKENDSNAMIIDLQNRIAELEEEKGNLQLHLVDFEELKAEGADLTAELESLRSQKVAAEMKGVELEEELDLLKREDNDALINTLNMQLTGQVDTCNRLSQTLLERDMELGDTQEKYSYLYQQTQDKMVELRAVVEAKDTEVNDYKKRLAHVQASLDEVLDTNNCIKRTIEKFCSDIVNGSFSEYSSQVQDTSVDPVDSLEEVKYLKSEQELLSVLSAARTILADREIQLHFLKTEISKTRDQTLNYENELQELELYRKENATLQNELDSLKCLVQEKEAEIVKALGLEVGSMQGNQSHEACQSQLRHLEQEKEKITEELKSTQVRSGKLIKKIKSMKSDYDNLAAENLKLSKMGSLGPNVERDNEIQSLQQEVFKLQSEVEKKIKRVEEASTQADDNQLSWLSNEYETVKQEVQHLIEEIDFKDAKSLQMAEQLQSKENTLEELSKMVNSLKMTIGEKEKQLVHLETLVQEHINKDDGLVSKEVEPHRRELNQVLHMLRQKEEQVAHLEELLQHRVHEEPEDRLTHKQLDDALYMLHQKEVRCDELTLELMQLLEERDTLQLRLSTSIRQYEELRASCSHTQEKCVPSPSSPALSNKLQEVRSVGREQRSMALQQRADTTVSRDNLSQSETLINWIRGRTTPKVMHI